MILKTFWKDFLNALLIKYINCIIEVYEEKYFVYIL